LFFVFWTEEVAAICLAVVLEQAGLPSLGNDLKMIALRPDNEGDPAVLDRCRSLEAALR